jgi:hypothetical protein
MDAMWHSKEQTGELNINCPLPVKDITLKVYIISP